MCGSIGSTERIRKRWQLENRFFSEIGIWWRSSSGRCQSSDEYEGSEGEGKGYWNREQGAVKLERCAYGITHHGRRQGAGGNC